MSEAQLWKRVRDAVGDAGHWDRREGNPVPGCPDVSYCVDGVEGHIELKHHPDFPARPGTAVFGARTARGMRDDQVAWFYRRLRAGGRAYILAQVDTTIVLMHGSCAPYFNGYSSDTLRGHALWSIVGKSTPRDWTRFLNSLCGKF